MEKYNLVKLICFFKYQSERDYKEIKEVLDIVDSEIIPEEEKKEKILQTLREFGGLVEEGFVFELSEEELEEMIISMDEEEKEDLLKQIHDEQNIFRADMVELKTLNGSQIVLVPLN